MTEIKKVKEVPLIVDIDEEGNVTLSSKDENECVEKEASHSVVVTLVGFASEVLREFSELKVDKSLYDNANFAKAVTEKIKLQKAALK